MIIQITMFRIGMIARMIHHHCRPTILSSTNVFEIGMIDFQPASPAFVNDPPGRDDENEPAM